MPLFGHVGYSVDINRLIWEKINPHAGVGFYYENKSERSGFQLISHWNCNDSSPIHYVFKSVKTYQVTLDQFLDQLARENVDFPLVFEGFWRNNKMSVVPGRRREEG